MPLPKQLAFLNPFRGMVETDAYPYARYYRTDFLGKVGDAFNAIAGSSPFSDTNKDHIGLVDYLTLMIPYLCKQSLWWCGRHFESDNTIARETAQTLIAPLFIINVPIFACRYLISGLLTLLALPVIGVAHVLSKEQGNKLVEEANKLILGQADDEHDYSLGDHLRQFEQSENDVEIKCFGTYQKLTLEFYDGKPLHPKDRPKCTTELDLTQSEHKTALQAMLQLNAGGITRRLEKRGISLAPFFADSNVAEKEGEIDTLTQAARAVRS